METLNGKEIQKLRKLGREIKLLLESCSSLSGIPCKTCRDALTDAMQEYLKVALVSDKYKHLEQEADVLKEMRQ